MEIHLQKVNRETHLFQLVKEGVLRSYCGLNSTPDYSKKNLKNIYFSVSELDFFIGNDRLLFVCDICRASFGKLSSHDTL